MPRPQITRARPWTPSSGVFAGQTFSSERQYRNALARLHGFASWDAQQRAQAPEVHGRMEFRRLRPSEQGAYERTGMALTLMRRDGLSLQEATRQIHTTPAAVKRYAGDALIRGSHGRYLVTASDTHFRRLLLPGVNGVVIVETTNSRTATEVAEYDAAVRYFLATGNAKLLDRFRGKALRVKGKRYPFITDLDVLEELGRRGEISFESIYADAA